MKSLFLAATLLLVNPSASAGTLLRNLYATNFCELRAMGASKEDAMEAALNSALISGDDWTWVTIDGHRYQSDTLLAIQAAYNLCPHYAR